MKTEIIELPDDDAIEPSLPKRVKREPVDSSAQTAAKLPQESNTILYLYREQVKALPKAEIKLLLEFNNQLVPSKKEEVNYLRSILSKSMLIYFLYNVDDRSLC